MADRHGICTYPGVLGVISASYTNSHGITPGVITIVCQPQDTLPAQQGDVVITDGVGTIRIPDCRLDELKTTLGGGGLTTWTLLLKDRRWRWAFGSIRLTANALDDHAKLLPFTIRSPREIAEACLTEMNEGNYELNLPNGLGQSFGTGIDRLLTAGENFPVGINPPVVWDSENPASCLQTFVDQFGCRIVYRIDTDSVFIGPVGVGADLPDGSIHQAGPSIKGFAVPDAIRVVGAPTKFQARLDFSEAVGIDHDSSVKPINQLSYAPDSPGAVQVSRISVSSMEDPLTESREWTMTVDGSTFTHTNAIGDTPAMVTTAFFNFFTTELQIDHNVTVEQFSPTVLEFRGVRDGYSFTITASVPDGVNLDGAYIQVILFQRADDGIHGWDYCNPFDLADVTAVPGHLTYQQALDLAKSCVFKMYRLVNADVGTGEAPITIPGYAGQILRKQQIVLTSEMCEQIVPVNPDPRFFNPNPGPDESLEGFIENQYNGFSRSRPAKAYGAWAGDTAGIFSVAATGANTPGNEPIFVPFRVDATNQLIIFERPVAYLDDNRYIPASVTLETGVFIRDSSDNCLICFTKERRIGTAEGDTKNGVEILHRPDVQVNTLPTYEFVLSDNQVDYLSRVKRLLLLETDPMFRADYYLDAAMLKYQVKGATSLIYNGILSVACDGAISQVSWSIGGGGPATTTASRNQEHNQYVPAYPARRRAENLAPAVVESERTQERVRLDRPPAWIGEFF